MPGGKLVPEQVLTIQEIADRYEGEWVLVKILDLSGPRGEAPGVVLAHGPDRKKMSTELKKAWKRDPNSHLWVMQGGGKFGDGEALRRALARIAAEEEFISVNNW